MSAQKIWVHLITMLLYCEMSDIFFCICFLNQVHCDNGEYVSFVSVRFV